MIKTGLNIFLFLFISFPGSSQITFLKDVAPVIKSHCIACHKDNGSAPFSLQTYNDVKKRAAFILEVIEDKYMPPYPADPLFAAHANTNVVSQKEISIIKNWIRDGKLKGKSAKKEVEPLKPTVQVKPDRIFRPAPLYIIPGDNTEKFKIFVVPTNLKDTTYISAVEYIPGNARRTHHSRIMIDTSNLLRKDNGIDVGDSSEFQKSGVKMFDEFWKGWVPGNKVSIFYPRGMAKMLPPNADLIINTHYAPGPLEEDDNFSINLYFAKETPKRFIKTFIIDESDVVNGPFFIPPDSLITFYGRSQPLPYDMSLINVLPHMHVLGKSFKAFAITPAAEVVPLIYIPKWQFNWQLTYPFEKLLKLPKGAIIYIQATYDNTSNNLLNPFNPPRPFFYGWGTKNEMMNLIFEFVEYQSGDEKISTSQDKY
jgi:hypothetical protein